MTLYQINDHGRDEFMFKASIKKISTITILLVMLVSLIPTIVLGANPWAPNTSYAVNDLVTYGGSTYKCLQAHTTQVGWEPPIVPALWQLQAGGADTTAPSTPANLASPSKTSTTVNLTWTASTDNVGVTSYDVYRGGTILAGNSTSTSITVSGLTANTAYSFTVKAKDAAGNISAASTALSVTTSAVAGDTTAPTSPTNLASPSKTSTTVNLTWTASTDNVGVTSYDVYRGGTNLAGNATGTSFTVSGLTASTAYSFTVKAKDAAGNISAASTALSVTTSAVAGDTTAPTAPTNLASPSKTSTTVNLTWTASTDNVGVTGYNVYRAGTILAGSPAGTSLTVSGLTASTAYSFTVKAKDAAGNISAASTALSVTTSAVAGGNYKIIGYYPSWGVYGRAYTVPMIDASKVTHINFAFADICWNGVHGNPDPTGPNPVTWTCQDEVGVISGTANGTIVQGDPWADSQMSYPGDLWDTPIKGSYNQLVKLKAANPNLKTIISVGGWSWSNHFSDVAASVTTRTTFANSAVAFLRKYQFDGVDLDWEYPVGGGLAGNSALAADKTNYTLLLQAIRNALDTAGAADGKHYILTIASGASLSYIANTQLSSIASIVDWINIMTYDFHGSFDPTSGNNAPLTFDPADNSANKNSFYDDAAVTNYIAAGVPANKIVMGVPFYGRGWSGCTNVNHGLYQSCSPATTGTWESGSYDFTDLQNNYINLNGYTRYWNSAAQVPYLYNPSNGNFITYDDTQSIGLKDDYIKNHSLGGAMFWEFSGDRNKTLLNQVSSDLPH
jgi:chitinase